MTFRDPRNRHNLPKKQHYSWKRVRREYRHQQKANFSRVEKIPFISHSTYLQKADAPYGDLNQVQTDVAYVSQLQQRQFGTNIPGWKQLIVEGKAATTTAENYRSGVKSLGWFDWALKIDDSTDSIRNVNWSRFSGTLPPSGFSGPSIFIDTDQEDEAKSAFIRKARKLQTSTLGGEFIRDISHNLHSFNNVRDVFLRSFRQHVLSTKLLRDQFLGINYHSRKSRGKDAIKALTSKHLEWYYGITPTISDLQDIGFALWRSYDRSFNGDPWARVRGWSERTSKLPLSQYSAGLGTPSGPLMRIDAKFDVVAVRYIAFYGAIRTLAAQNRVVNVFHELGFGLRDFIPTLWEFVPYSFIVDYFTNTGQILSALTFPRSDVRWVNRVVRNFNVVTTNYSKRFAIPPSGKILEDSFVSSSSELYAFAYSRSLFTGSLVPAFRMHLPYRESAWAAMLSLIGNSIASSR